jgi:hypothetical protein
MKKTLLLLTALFATKTWSQCATSSSTVSASIYSMTTVYNSTMGLNVAICCNGVLYDTLTNNNNMNYFIHPGGVLYKKNGVTTRVWLDGACQLINKGGTSAILAYTESTSTITNLGSPPVSNTSCTNVAIPNANCFPVGGPCGTPSFIKDLNGYSANISIVNPVSEKLQIENNNKVILTGKVYDVVGRFLFELSIDPGSNTYQFSEKKKGVYFMNILDAENQVVLTHKILVE